MCITVGENHGRHGRAGSRASRDSPSPLSAAPLSLGEERVWG
jgi:hypothetical protein